MTSKTVFKASSTWLRQAISAAERLAEPLKDRAAYDGVYLTAELLIWYFRALAAGEAQSRAPVDALIRNARP